MQECGKMTFSAMLDSVVKQFPRQSAIIFEDKHISYLELKDQVQTVARAFLAMGIGKGDTVSIWLYNCPEWIYIQLALGMIGAVLVPINTRFKVKELEYTLKQSDSRILVMMDQFLNVDYTDSINEAIPELESCSDCEQIRSEEFPMLRKIICIGDCRKTGMVSWKTFLRKAEEVSLKELDVRIKNIKAADIVMLQYTSGTTSFPKGVMLTHGGVIRDSLSMGQRMTVSSNDRMYCPLPFFHVGGAIISTLIAFVNGASLVFSKTYDPTVALNLIQKEQCTVMNGVESHFVMIYEHPEFENYDVSSLVKGWAIGQPEIIRSIYERMGIKKIVNVYGISEASPNVTTTLVDDPLEFRMHWQGKPHLGTEVRITDIGTGEEVPRFQNGEICVRGWNVMKGYYNNPEETKSAIDSEGWLHTGDFGLMDEDGNLQFKGRIKDIIRVGGENVSAWEVESHILTHPQVQNVAIIGVPDNRLTEVCMAIVQPKHGLKLVGEEIIGYCKGKIANFKVPRYVKFVDEFPMTGSGKIKKTELKKLYAHSHKSAENRS